MIDVSTLVLIVGVVCFFAGFCVGGTACLLFWAITVVSGAQAEANEPLQEQPLKREW